MKGKIGRIIGALLVAAGIVIATQGSAGALAPKTTGEARYQAWLDETAVIVHNEDGTEQRYTEREIGIPAFQEQKHQQFVGGVSTQAVYWGCPAGIGCTWRDTNGGGPRWDYSISEFGTNDCFAHGELSNNNSISSVSADYGNGWDHKFWQGYVCFGSWYAILSSHSAGVLPPGWNDTISASMITQVG